jgi:hypothetical protein
LAQKLVFWFILLRLVKTFTNVFQSLPSFIDLRIVLDVFSPLRGANLLLLLKIQERMIEAEIVFDFFIFNVMLRMNLVLFFVIVFFLDFFHIFEEGNSEILEKYIGFHLFLIGLLKRFISDKILFCCACFLSELTLK